MNNLSETWLGTFGGILAVLGVIAAPITSGDTALRSARLIAADFLHFPQKKIRNRLMVSVPIFVLCFVVMLMPYDVLWRYFAWCNQVLSVFTLWAVTVWLAKQHKNYFITLIPALFMTAVTVTYICFAPEGLSLLTQEFFGSDIPYTVAVGAGLAACCLFLGLFARFLKGREPKVTLDPEL